MDQQLVNRVAHAIKQNHDLGYDWDIIARNAISAITDHIQGAAPSPPQPNDNYTSGCGALRTEMMRREREAREYDEKRLKDEIKQELRDAGAQGAHDFQQAY